MANTVQCDIVSVERSIFSGKATQVIVPGSEGEMGVRPGHEPLLTLLAPGPVQVTLEDGKDHIFYVSGGILEVQPDSISVLADTAERGGDLDEAAAQKALEDARNAASQKSSDFDYTTALAEIAEAQARLRALKKARGM